MTTLYNIEDEITQMYNEAATALQATLNEIDKWLVFTTILWRGRKTSLNMKLPWLNTHATWYSSKRKP